MADKEKMVYDSSSSSRDQSNVGEEDLMAFYGSESGWVEARTHCDHLDTLSADLTHIPTPDTPCNSDLSVWCFSCNSYLDAQVILPLRSVHETAYILKFGEAPPFRTIECLEVGDNKVNGSTSGN